MNSYLESPSHSVTLDLSWARAVGYSHVGKVRSTNEDRFLLNAWPEQEGILAVVADGMGGNSAGDIAAQLAIDTFAELLTNPLPLEPLQQYDALLEKCYLADERIRLEGVSSFKTLGMGTTIVAAILTPTTCVHVFAGDSRLYHFRQGQQQYQTTDHSIVQMLLEAGRIQPEDIPTHPMRSIVNSCLGGKAGDGNFSVDPKWNEANPPIMTLKAEDLTLLCSDGLSSYIPEAQLQRLIAEYYHSPSTLNKLLLQDVLEQSKASDNITLITLAIRQIQNSFHIQL
jgi:protein phosphatase